MKFAFVREHQGEFPVGLLCEILNVSRSGYYVWKDRPLSERAERIGRITEQIREVHNEAWSVYASRRVTMSPCHRVSPVVRTRWRSS